ncbi:MAG: single-stranded DNA-binding protein [Clostridia bacterium]|nr:single-stranded DNA-binding protein [Clostridia bacterium]
MGNYTENNKVVIAGTVASEPEFSHEVYEESFYTFMLDTPRLSEVRDVIRITVSEKFLAGDGIQVGDKVRISGQFRSYNNFSNVGNRLILTVFVKDIEKTEEEEENSNSIYLNGYICKQPVYRTTPFGREIADILLAVNRSYNKSDYIPCIAWGRNAKYAETLKIGDNVIIKGRIQSREYQKKISETEVESKTAFEVSVAKLEVVERDVADDLVL